jgi:hypothetical protein
MVIHPERGPAARINPRVAGRLSGEWPAILIVLVRDSV